MLGKREGDGVFKVMIVDDEALAVQFLTGLIRWEDFDCQVVGCALTADQAMTCARVKCPDIVFMDIRMPQVDGLELSRRVCTLCPGTRIIFLTAYRDFEYAQHAVQLGAIDFLIKHELTSDSLASALRGAVKRIREERDVKALARQKNLYDIVMLNRPADAAHTLFSARAQYALLLVFSHPCARLFEQGTQEPPPRLDEALLSPENGVSVVETSALGDETQCALMAAADAPGYQRAWVDMRAAALRLKAGMEAAWPGRYQVALSLLFTDAQGLARAGHALVAAPHEAPIRRRDPLYEDAFSGMPRFHPVFSPDYVRRLLEMIHLRDAAAQQALQAPIAEAGDARCALSELTPLTEAIRALQSLWDAGPEALYREAAAGGALASLSDLTTFLGGCVNELVRLPRSLYSRPRDLARAVDHYIQSHYSDDLSIDRLAENFDVSGGYLRSIFKREHGITIKRAIQEARIQAAKRLLLSHEYTVAEIALLCGFKTSQHFSMVFKSEVGLSPTDFLSGTRKE